MVYFSEFDEYRNLTFIELNLGAHYCLEIGRYIKGQKLTEAIDSLEWLANESEELATEAIELDFIDGLVELNELDNRLDSLTAKLELDLAGTGYTLN